MAATHHLLVRNFFFLLQLSPFISTYKISTVGSPGVCNETIYLEEGAKSAAILRLTSKDFYDFAPLNCVITFKAPQHSWSGLTGVLEEVDLRRYEDTADHHLAQNQCVDYIKVLPNTAMPQDEQCGSWSVNGGEKLSHLGFRRSLFGYCPNPPAPGSVVRCGVSEIKVQVSVGQRDFSSLRRGKPWRSYRGFTFVVTAYRYSFGESGCIEGLQSCGKTDYHGYQHHCIHKSLWCDHHINCGQPTNNDELRCHNDEMLNGLVTVMVGPWVGAALLVVLVLAGVLYWRRARPPPPQGPPQPQDHNSYAESYEVSSTMSSAHHMAIQVRVVCNSGHGMHTPRMSPWQTSDLPPSYDSLFPQGPPPPKVTTTATTTTTTTSATSFNISTTSLVSATIGSNTNPTSGPSGYFSNTTQTSSIVIPISAICNTLGSSAMSSASYNANTFTNTITSSTPSVTNTTTSTTTIASVGASPAALASISVTSVSLAGPSGDITSKRNKDTINPTHDNVSSNSSRAPTPSNCLSRAPTPNNCPSRVPTPNNCLKPDLKENPSYGAEATPPLVEPEDTNITPCNSTVETPASVDVMLPYTFSDAAHNNPSTINELCDHVAVQSSDIPLLNPESENGMRYMETMSIAADAVIVPDSLTAPSATIETDDCHWEVSDVPDSESEEMEDINSKEAKASSHLVTKVEEVKPNIELNMPSSSLSQEPTFDTETEPSMLETMEEEANDMLLESSSDIAHALDKDNESLL